MNRFEKIGLVVLFFVSVIYSYIKPSDVVENIETKQQIIIYVEGEYTQKLSFSYKPQIKDVLNKLHVENNYHFDETTQLASETILYLPHGDHLLSLNQATLEELMTLQGIGEKTAQKIIDYRQETPFKTIEDITKVSGIGEKMYLRMREYLCL